MTAPISSSSQRSTSQLALSSIQPPNETKIWHYLTDGAPTQSWEVKNYSQLMHLVNDYKTAALNTPNPQSKAFFLACAKKLLETNKRHMNADQKHDAFKLQIQLYLQEADACQAASDAIADPKEKLKWLFAPLLKWMPNKIYQYMTPRVEDPDLLVKFSEHWEKIGKIFEKTKYQTEVTDAYIMIQRICEYQLRTVLDAACACYTQAGICLGFAHLFDKNYNDMFGFELFHLAILKLRQWHSGEIFEPDVEASYWERMSVLQGLLKKDSRYREEAAKGFQSRLNAIENYEKLLNEPEWEINALVSCIENLKQAIFLAPTSISLIEMDEKRKKYLRILEGKSPERAHAINQEKMLSFREYY